MNLSIIPLYSITILVRKIRQIAKSIDMYADYLEARRSLTKLQKEILQRNAKFENCHKNKPAYVIVNGPSLAQQDISELKNEITFACSGFWKHHIIEKWEPTYYSLSDHNFFNNSQSTQDFYIQLKNKIKKSIFFIPLYRGYDAIHKFNYLPLEKTYYLAATGTKVAGNDLTGITQGFGSVSAFSLSQAIYMGCSPIYLLGFDHDYLANRGIDRHFYEGGTIAGHSQAAIPLADRVPYDEEMKANLGLWSNYRSLKSIAEKKGIAIYNCTKGGYLDVFPRRDFDLLNPTKNES